MDRFVRTHKRIARDPLVRFIRKRMEELRSERDLVMGELQKVMGRIKFESNRIRRLQLTYTAQKHKTRAGYIVKQINYARKALEFRKQTLIIRNR